MHLRQELKNEMENGINNLFLVAFNLFFINFVVLAQRIRFGNRTLTNVPKVYFFLLAFYISERLSLNNILLEFSFEYL